MQNTLLKKEEKQRQKTLADIKRKGLITEISVSWCAEDVLHLNAELTAEQVQDVLHLAKAKHDADVGISWDVLYGWIDVVLNES